MVNALIFSSYTVYTGVWRCLLMYYPFRLAVVGLYFLCICISWSLLRLAVKVETLIRNAIYLLLVFFKTDSIFHEFDKKKLFVESGELKKETILFNIWKSINKIKFEQVLKEGIFYGLFSIFLGMGVGASGGITIAFIFF